MLAVSSEGVVGGSIRFYAPSIAIIDASVNLTVPYRPYPDDNFVLELAISANGCGQTAIAYISCQLWPCGRPIAFR